MSYRHKHINPKIRNLRPKKRIWKSPVFWAAILVVLIAMGIFYLVFFFPNFQVKNIQISGNVKVGTEQIENLTMKHIYKKILSFTHESIFLINIGGITADVLQTFPVIEKVEVKKDYFDSITLNITERSQFAVFCAQAPRENCFSIDSSGVIFEPLESLSKDMVVLTRQATDEEISVGKGIIQKNIMDVIGNIQSELKNNFQINVKDAFVSNPLILRTSENWNLYFDPDGDIQAQITKMNLLLKDQITPSARKNLQYIYLQYKDRAYYK